MGHAARMMEFVAAAVVVVLLVAVDVSGAAVTPELASAVWDSQRGLAVVRGIDPGALAWANFTDRISSTGWSHLTLATNEKYDDALQAYAAGVLEANVTSKYIKLQWQNTMEGYCAKGPQESAYCGRLEGFLKDNLDWMNAQIEAEPENPLWHQVRLALLQFKGIEDGMSGNIALPTGRIDISPFGFYLGQIATDLGDLEQVLNKTAATQNPASGMEYERRGPVGKGHCSALIRLLPDGQDLLTSHVTWGAYQSMLRIVKNYQLAFHTTPKGQQVIPGHEQAFSSYPGVTFSIDDFYILSSGLVVLETTIENNNPELWHLVQPKGQLLEWLRNVVANRLATSGQHWAETFRQHNSGTYNNEWMVVDYKRFATGSSKSRSGILTVLEQMPGLVVSSDLTDVLYKEQYWASYNIPYFQKIWNVSDQQALVDKFGDWFDHDRCPRAQIFRRDVHTVTDLPSMVHLMRYNNFMNDPLSACKGCVPGQNAEFAIAARCDLNPANGTYPCDMLQQRSHGATDMKITSKAMVPRLEMVAQSGPTWDQQPPFQWSKSPFPSLSHVGQPDLWSFLPEHISWRKHSGQ
ncbi:putative phospholipase B-like 2 isoform X2 [Lampetra fluviatilis]